MSVSPFFSVIIPTYNSEVSISRALKSLTEQTFENFEIIVVDGNSTDATLSIVESYRLNYPNIRVYSEMDKGIYDAMNKGINRSSGSWLYFMGSDDFLYNETVLLDVYHKIVDTSLDAVYGNVHFHGLNRLYDGKFTYEKLFHKNICHQAIFLRRPIFEKIGNFDISFTSVADWHHNVRWFYNHKIQHKFIDLTIAEYSDGGYSSQHRDQKFLDVKSEMFLKYGFFKLPIKNLVAITTKIVKKHKKQKNHYKLFTYGFLLFCLKAKQRIINN